MKETVSRCVFSEHSVHCWYRLYLYSGGLV